MSVATEAVESKSEVATVERKTALVLRTCDAHMSSHNGFKWPESGPVECSDWHPRAECGNGLHGLLWGEGDGSLLNWGADAKWLVVEVDESTVVQIGGKVKFPRGEVVFCGDRLGATGFLVSRLSKAAKVVGACVSAGDRGTATAGYMGTATAGDMGTATAGYMGTATAGDRGTATAGYMGTATAGDSGTATAGDRGTATAGYMGTATAGYMGTATAGDRGTATAGEDGVLILKFWDGLRLRPIVAVVGENGIEPNIAYKLDENRKVVRAE